MINLVIDRGNSACKWAFFELDTKQPDWNKDPIEIVHTTSEEFIDESYLEKYHPDACIYSSVGKKDEAQIARLRSVVPHFCVHNIDMRIPIQNAYRTPKTLGLDRLAAAVGAWTLAPNQTSLIVDMGTAITYDILTKEGVYLGGNIAPGIYLRLKILHEGTASLPMVEARDDFPELGTDTETAIRAGVMQGIWNELESYMRYYKAKDEHLLTFLIGGDVFYFDRKLKSDIFAGRNLVLIGLNRILYENAPI